MNIKLSQQELANVQLNPETLQNAIAQIKIDGYVILEQLLPKSVVAHLHETFMKIFTEHVERTGVDTQDVNAETKRGANRFLMHLPFVEPFNDPLIIENPIVLQIMDAMLGPDYNCRYFATDTPLPGSDYQGVHSDDAPLFPETDLVLPPAALVVNVPFIDTTVLNGAMDIWPGGTHRIPENMNQPKLIQDISAAMTPQKVLINAGSVLIRDLRMWHRGTPNNSDAARPNMAFIYNRPWYIRDYSSPRIQIQREVYETLSKKAQHMFKLENIIG